MKKKIIFVLHFLWSSFVAFTFPFCLAWIWLDISGHAKGYGYDLGSEKDISIMMGCIELFIWLILAVPSNAFVLYKIGQKKKLLLLIPVCLFIVLALICIHIMGGWSEYGQNFHAQTGDFI